MKTPDDNPKRILIVDDEPTICDICRRVLTGEWLEVDIAANGKIAQDMIKKKQYDLCLLDIRTPEMNGKELYQWLRTKYPRLTNGVIFTTGDVLSGDIPSSLEQNNRPFLPKPFAPDEIKAIVGEVLKEAENGRRTDKNSGC